MRSLKFLLDADMSRSSAKLIRSLDENEIKNSIIIVELTRYRRRPLQQK